MEKFEREQEQGRGVKMFEKLWKLGEVTFLKKLLFGEGGKGSSLGNFEKREKKSSN